MSQGSSQEVLLSRLYEVVARRPDAIAVRAHDRELDYAGLSQLIQRIRCIIEDSGRPDNEPVGLLLDRTATAYAAMFAAASCGRPYVPLNPTFPHSRLQDIIDQSGAGFLLHSEASRELAAQLTAGGSPIAGVAEADLSDSQAVGETDWHRATIPGDIAYILFTSGSTGRPKGVPVSYDNLLAFVDNMNATIRYEPDDVCSQVCELSFDFSVHEIYLALLNGCTVCPARRIDLFHPAHFIEARSVSIFIAVPSLARVVLSTGIEIGAALSGLRLSIFNGEALHAGLAAAWHRAAPNAEVWNTYGPTECTVAVTAQRWRDDPRIVEKDVVSIGRPFEDCAVALLRDGDVVEAKDGNAGELLLATPQRFSGYLDPGIADPMIVDDEGTVFYRTGDLVRSRSGRLYHLGRIDHQVKIGGHRIEILEIEHRLRQCLDTDTLAVVASPVPVPTELVLFVEGSQTPSIPDAGTLSLPPYMLPTRTVTLENLPTNPHGKLDRAALQSIAQETP